MVCSVNLWCLLGKNKKPEDQKANENNKEEAKKGNRTDGARVADAGKGPEE